MFVYMLESTNVCMCVCMTHKKQCHRLAIGVLGQPPLSLGVVATQLGDLTLGAPPPPTSTSTAHDIDTPPHTTTTHDTNATTSAALSAPHRVQEPLPQATVRRRGAPTMSGNQGGGRGVLDGLPVVADQEGPPTDGGPGVHGREHGGKEGSRVSGMRGGMGGGMVRDGMQGVSVGALAEGHHAGEGSIDWHAVAARSAGGQLGGDGVCVSGGLEGSVKQRRGGGGGGRGRRTAPRFL